MTELHPDDRIAERGDTAFRDYILTDYAPLADPAGRLRQESVYRWALREAGLLDRAWPAIEALRAHLGPDRTVWGIKWGPQGFTTELYFYNNASNPPGHPMQVTTLSRVLAPWLRIDADVDEALPYFMASIDLDAATLGGAVAPWHVYVGSGDARRKQSGFSYRTHGPHALLENHYWFYDPKTELDEVWRRLRHSPRARGDRSLLPDWLWDAHTICVAVKPRHIGLYAARVSTAVARRFHEQHGPAPLAALLATHQGDLAHLRWDLGWDVRLDDSGAPFVERVALHGCL